MTNGVAWFPLAHLFIVLFGCMIGLAIEEKKVFGAASLPLGLLAIVVAALGPYAWVWLQATG